MRHSTLIISQTIADNVDMMTKTFKYTNKIERIWIKLTWHNIPQAMHTIHAVSPVWPTFLIG